MKLRNLQFLTWIVGLSACSSVQMMEQRSIESGDFTVTYDQYTPDRRKAVPRTVIIFPPTGGATFLEASYARKLAQNRGASVFVLKSWTGDQEAAYDLKVHQRLHSRAIQALRVTLKSIDPSHKVSVLGTSLGGIYTTVAASTVDEVERVFVIAGGSPIPTIISESEHHSMTGVRKKRFETFEFKSRDDYAKAIAKVFHLDPTNLPKIFLQKKRGLVVLTNDEAVPTPTQINLSELWQPDMLIEINANHYWGIARSWISYQTQIVDFLSPEKIRNTHNLQR